MRGFINKDSEALVWVYLQVLAGKILIQRTPSNAQEDVAINSEDEKNSFIAEARELIPNHLGISKLLSNTIVAMLFQLIHPNPLSLNRNPDVVFWIINNLISSNGERLAFFQNLSGKFLGLEVINEYEFNNQLKQFSEDIMNFATAAGIKGDFRNNPRLIIPLLDIQLGGTLTNRARRATYSDTIESSLNGGSLDPENLKLDLITYLNSLDDPRLTEFIQGCINSTTSKDLDSYLNNISDFTNSIPSNILNTIRRLREIFKTLEETGTVRNVGQVTSENKLVPGFDTRRF